MIEGKRVVLVDDSIVRGTTSVKIVHMMREAGAKEVHFRIACPPITHPDFYGIDTPEQRQAARRHARRSRRCAHIIGVDSLAFLSVDGLYRAMGEARPRPACGRNSPTTASPATIRPRSPTSTVATPRRSLSLLAEAG